MLKIISLSICSLLFLPFQLFAQPKEFKIGSLQQLSGEFAAYGQAILEGTKLAVDEANEVNKDEINAKDNFKLKLITYDHQLNAQKAFMYAKKLVEIDKVDAILISDYHPAKGIGPYVERKKIPMIVLWDSNPELENMGYYTFGIGPWTPSSGELVAEVARNKFGAKRAALITYQDEWAISCGDYFKKRFLAEGGEILSDDVIQGDEPDFKTILARIKSKKPDMIYSLLTLNNLTFMRQFHELNLNIPHITSDILTPDILAAAKSEYEGVYQTQGADPDFPATRAMKEKFRKSFGKDPEMPSFTAWGYDGVGLIAEAIKKGAKSSEEIARGLYQIKDYDGAFGSTTINERGSAPKYAKLYQVRAGKLVPAN